MRDDQGLAHQRVQEPQHLDVVVHLGNGTQRRQVEAAREHRRRAQGLRARRRPTGRRTRTPRARSVAWRSGPVSGPVSSRNRSPSRSRTSIALMAAIRAAASSMPRGSPSSVSQISMTASAVCSSKMPNPGRTAWARSANRSPRRRSPPSTVRGATDTSISPGARRCSRDVARTRGASERVRISPIAAAAAASTCSQLSTTMSIRRPATESATVSIIRAPPCGVMPRTVAIASGTAAGSSTGASSTSQTPSGKSSASVAPTARARRVLPTPPTPARVTSGRERTVDATSVSASGPPDEGGGGAWQVAATSPPGSPVSLHRRQCGAAWLQSANRPRSLADVRPWTT